MWTVDDPPFVLFGTTHLLTVLTIIALSAALPSAMARSHSIALKHRLGIGLGVALLAHELLKSGMRVHIYGAPLAEQLPLHLCGMAALLVSYTLIRRSYGVFEVVYFWGLGGTTQALLTPDLRQGFPGPLYLSFFFGHGLVVLGVLYATVVYGFRPTLRSLGKTLLVTLTFMALVAPLNLALGTNFLFLRHKPEQASLMDYFGPWPWYILTLVLVGMIVCLICYAPFPVLSWLSKRGVGNR